MLGAFNYFFEHVNVHVHVFVHTETNDKIIGFIWSNQSSNETNRIGLLQRIVLTSSKQTCCHEQATVPNEFIPTSKQPVQNKLVATNKQPVPTNWNWLLFVWLVYSFVQERRIDQEDFPAFS